MSDPWAFGWTQLFTIFGLAISAWFAYRGLRTLDKWRDEQIEQRKIEVGLDALAIAYEAGFVFEQIRSRLSTSAEWQDMPALENETAAERMRRGSLYAVFKRLEHQKEFFERVWKLQPKFMAVFGSDTEKVFELLFKARSQLRVSLEMLMWDFREQPSRDDKDNYDLWVQMRRDIRSSHGAVRDPQDTVGKNIDDFVSKVEALCRPLVVQRYSRAKS